MIIFRKPIVTVIIAVSLFVWLFATQVVWPVDTSNEPTAPETTLSEKCEKRDPMYLAFMHDC